ADTSSYSLPWHFITKDSIAPPTLKLPLNNSLGIQLSAKLKWNQALNAVKYNLMLSSDPSFTTNYTYALSDTSINLGIFPLSYNTKYYWKVRTISSTDTSAYSNTWNFTTSGTKVQPTLLNPANNATHQTLGLSFKWNKVLNTSAYIFELSNTLSFDNILFTATISDTTINASGMGLDNSSNYYWRIRAYKLADTTDYSNIWKFKTTYTVSLTLDSLALSSNKIKSYGTYTISDEGEIQSKGFVYSKNTNPTILDSSFVVSGSSLNGISNRVDTKSTYYVKAFISTPIGTHYSSQQSISIGNLLRIALEKKWNLISSNLDGFADSVQNVFKDIKNNITIIKDDKGKSYIPAYNVNQINVLNIKKSYLVYSQIDQDLDIMGNLLDSANAYLDLKVGWNNIAYLLENPKNVALVLKDLVDSNQLLIIKDFSGRVYIPSFNINSIGNMMPGKGYYLYNLQNYRFYYYK
ncbi:MAG TPA: hypothetical protein PLE30_05015, partial [Candidatus Kapabacteria bacterium]|nr:hypothetical protein [Candidatus Kapabacteria bacterium]